MGREPKAECYKIRAEFCCNNCSAFFNNDIGHYHVREKKIYCEECCLLEHPPND